MLTVISIVNEEKSLRWLTLPEVGHFITVYSFEDATCFHPLTKSERR